jgi:hypothetical protein
MINALVVVVTSSIVTPEWATAQEITIVDAMIVVNMFFISGTLHQSTIRVT